MARRFVSIWFRNLATDWFSLGQPHLRNVPFVLRAPSHGRMVIVAANIKAKCKGVQEGMVLADARAFIPDLEVLDNKPDLTVKLLRRLAISSNFPFYCIGILVRYNDHPLMVGSMAGDIFKLSILIDVLSHYFQPVAGIHHDLSGGKFFARNICRAGS